MKNDQDMKKIVYEKKSDKEAQHDTQYIVKPPLQKHIIRRSAGVPSLP